eukprot:1182366-Prorocentrum_minimum.AAC.1
MARNVKLGLNKGPQGWKPSQTGVVLESKESESFTQFSPFFHNNTTSFYGSSCLNNGKGALNTPGSHYFTTEPFYSPPVFWPQTWDYNSQNKTPTSSEAVPEVRTQREDGKGTPSTASTYLSAKWHRKTSGDLLKRRLQEETSRGKF